MSAAKLRNISEKNPLPRKQCSFFAKKKIFRAKCFGGFNLMFYICSEEQDTITTIFIN